MSDVKKASKLATAALVAGLSGCGAAQQFTDDMMSGATGGSKYDAMAGDTPLQKHCKGEANAVADNYNVLGTTVVTATIGALGGNLLANVLGTDRSGGAATGAFLAGGAGAAHAFSSRGAEQTSVYGGCIKTGKVPTEKEQFEAWKASRHPQP